MVAIVFTVDFNEYNSKTLIVIVVRFFNEKYLFDLYIIVIFVVVVVNIRFWVGDVTYISRSFRVSRQIGYYVNSYY